MTIPRFVSKSFRSGRIAKTYRNVPEKLHGDSGINAGKSGVKKSLLLFIIFPKFFMKLDFQIDNEQSLAYLIEIRNVTVVCISIIPFDCTVFELISLTDEIYKTIQKYPRSNIYIYIYVLLKLFLKIDKSLIKFLIFDCSIIESYSGLMCLVNLFEKDISFIIIFGLRSLNSENNNTLNGVLSACQILKEVKHIIGIKAILIGVSCGNLSNFEY